MNRLHLSAFLLLAVISIGLFIHLVYVRYRYLRLGKPIVWEWRFAGSWQYLLGQKKLRKDKRSGWMHVIMFYGFILLQVAAIDLFYRGIFPGKYILQAWLNGVEEITILLVLVATAYAYYRRYIEKLPRLKRSFHAGIVIVLLFALLCSMVVTVAFEKVWLNEELSWMTPLSSALAALFVQLPPSIAGILFYVGWWSHVVILFAFLLYLPQSKHFHLFVAPLNVFLRREQPGLAPLDFSDESVETFGASKIEDFTQKQLLDLYACVECGRCTDVCPASGTGKMLSPMDLIVNLRDHLTAKGAAITSTSPWLPAAAFATAGVANAELIGGVVTQQELWACTTCRNCEDACPVMNEHVDKIIDMRRYLTLTTGEIPAAAARTLGNIERQGNPWGLSKHNRTDWIAESAVVVPTVEEKTEFEYLLFVGSMGSYDQRSKRITEAVVRLLHHAGVSFAVLGNQEQNSGDTARRLGNEFLFQQQAEANIMLWKKYNVTKIITFDPHALHLFRHEYPAFGWQGEVLHHTQLLAQLLQAGKIRPIHPIKARITYHDSCYLGRYNGEYAAPREILSQIPGVELVEMERNRENALCCGAGGGLMWLEESEGKRINLARTEQALAIAPTMISSACPYCLTMLSDGVKALEVEGQVETMDVAEILAQSVFIL